MPVTMTLMPECVWAHPTPAPTLVLAAPKLAPDDAPMEVHSKHCAKCCCCHCCCARGVPIDLPLPYSPPACCPAPNPDWCANASPWACLCTHCPVCSLPTGPRTSPHGTLFSTTNPFPTLPPPHPSLLWPDNNFWNVDDSWSTSIVVWFNW